MSSEINTHEAKTQHEWPHIPTTRGEVVHIQGHPLELSLGGMDIGITTTVFSTWIFMIILFVVVTLLNRAVRTNSLPRTRIFGRDIMSRLDTYFTGLLWDKTIARRFLPFIGSFFIFIFLWNLLWLIFDYISMSVPLFHDILRPINSDMSTTLAMALSVILVAQITGVMTKGVKTHFGHYVFHFSGHSMIEKCINVFVGWIHLIGELARVVSLSLRLFGNIFAGVVLISVFAYISWLIPYTWGLFGVVFLLPFWFFELMVAFLQAFIFMTLSGMYIKESALHEKH